MITDLLKDAACVFTVLWCGTAAAMRLFPAAPVSNAVRPARSSVKHSESPAGTPHKPTSGAIRKDSAGTAGILLAIGGTITRVA